MSRFRCFDTYNLKNTTSSQRTTEVKRRTIFTEYQTIAIGNVPFQKGLTTNVIPPGYLRKDNGSYYYGPVYVNTDDIALNNCLIGAKNYELLYDMLFGAQPSPDDIKNSVVTYDGSAWQGNVLKTDTKTIGNIGPAITNIPNGEPDKMNYMARQDFLPKYDDPMNPPTEFPGIVIDPCYNMFYPRCSTEYTSNNYIKNVKFNFTAAQLENTELINYLRTSSARQYKKFPYQLNFQNTTCEKYPFAFVFSFINDSGESPDEILLKYMPFINTDNTISYDIEYTFSGVRDEVLTYTINFKYTGAPSDVDGLTFYPNGPSDTTLVDFYNARSDFTIKSFNLIPLSPLGGQFKNLNFIVDADDIPIIKPDTSLDEAFKGTNITLNGNSISNWRTAGVTTMNSTFMDSNFNGELNQWNTSNVDDMRSIFENNTAFNQLINSWDISKITDMSRMFYGATSFNSPLNDWDTSNVLNMNSVFKEATSFNHPLNNWDTSEVQNMSEMFMDASSFDGNIRTWNTEKVLTMFSMFKNAISFNQNISYDNPNNYWNTFNVQTFESIFENTVLFNDGQTPLPSPIAGTTNPLNWVNLYNFLPSPGIPNTANITLNSTLNAVGLTRENAVPFLKPSVFVYSFYDNSGTTATDICNNYLPLILNGSSILSDIVIDPSAATVGYRTVSFTLLYNPGDTNTGLSFYEPSDTKVNYYNTVGSGNPITILSFDGIVLANNGNQFSKLSNLDISSSTTVTIFPNTSLNNAFSETNNFSSSNLSLWNVKNAVNMSNMFRDTSFNEDISDWDTSNVVDMSSMFENNTDFNQDLSAWITSKVTDMSNMFKNATSFNSKLQYDPDPSNNYWDVSGVLDMTSMFENAISFNDGEGPGGITQPLNWQLNPLVDLTNVRTGAIELTNENAFPLPSLYTLKYEFYNQNSETDQDISNNIPILIAGPSTIISTSVVNSSVLPSPYKSVETIFSFPRHIEDLSSGFSFLNVTTFFNSNFVASPHIITQFDGMPIARNDNQVNPNGYQFANLSCQVDFSANDTLSILPNTTLSFCFNNNGFFNSPLNWDTSEVVSMKSMFEFSSFNQPINFITDKVTDMSNMFKGAIFNKNISYTGGPYWDVSGVIDMISIFEDTPIFNNGFDAGNTDNPLNWILNPNVNTTNCITNATNLTYENAFPLAELLDRFTYTFYNTQNLSAEDISNLYLPIIKTSDINLSYYYPPTITINPLDTSFTTVTVYYRYNDISSAIIDGVSFKNVYSIYNSNSLAKTITNFGSIPLAREDETGEGNQFSNINNLVFNSTTLPTILQGTTFENIFNSSSFNSDISGWDTSEVISLRGAFSNNSFNQPLDTWNTSTITDMSGVFLNNSAFNQPIGNWDTSNVINMSNMFYNSSSFNQDISGWNTGNVTTMENMFYNCTNFNQYLSDWNTSNVTTFEYLFYNCNNFNNGEITDASNSPLTWNTDSLLNLSNTFYEAIAFNQDISGWNTSNVTTMENLFREADNFNQPIGDWDVTNVINMSSVFYDAFAFNQDISGWDTGNVITMQNMFRNAISFNKQISYLPEISLTNWDTSGVLNMNSIFEGAITFNNGFGEGDIDNSLNWILNPNADITNAVINTPLLTPVNALPFSKLINGNFIYTFHNNTNQTDEDISNNYIPITDASGSFTFLSYSITHPLSPSDPSFTQVDVSFSFIELSGITSDGLSFYDPSNSKTDFYNSTSDRLTILQFGGIPLSRTGYQFANLGYLDISLNYSLDKPNILIDTEFDHTFYNTPTFNSGNIQDWDTIFVNNMSSMFEDSSFNQSLRMNTKNVTNMSSMFKNATDFNKNISYQPLSDINIWNTSNVTNMTNMFDGAISFNNGQSSGGTTQPLNWTLNSNVDISFVRINTPNLTNQNASPLPSIYTLEYNFYDNTGVSGEDIVDNYIPIILNGKSMLYNSSVVPSDSSTGNKSVSVELAYIVDNSNTGLSFYTIDDSITNFYNNNNNIPLTITQFDNIPLSRSDGSGNPNGYQFANLDYIVFSANDTPAILPNTTLSFCFYNSPYFNSDISGWNVLNATSMASMFENDISFNQPLQSWNTSNITNMANMFKNAISFNQTIKYIPSTNEWNVSSVTDMTSLFDGANIFNNGFPPYNYDNSLNWILNGGVNTTNAVTNTPLLTDFNGLPLTSSIYYPNEFIYKFYNTNGESRENIVFNYLPFIKTDDLVFDVSRNLIFEVVPGPSAETIIKIRFSFTDDGTTQDGLNFNATPDLVYFYNQTQQPVYITQFGGMPLSRYYKNPQQSFWETTTGTKFNSFGYNVKYGNANWVSVGGTSTNTILRSINGTTWSNVSGTVFSGIGYDVLSGSGTTWIAVGDDNGGTNTILRSSDDGASWNTVLGTKFSYAGYSLTYDNSGRWIVVGDDNGGGNTILTSTDDGLNWSTVSGTRFTLAGFGVGYDGINRWVAVGAGTNSILRSIDGGITWITISGTQFGSYGQRVVYDGSGRWVAIGHDNGGANTILTSTNDGATWSPVSGTTFSSYGQGLIYGNGRWVAVGYDNGGTNTILTSTDGETWQSCTGTFTFAGYGVSYSSTNNLWIAVGDNDGNTNTILNSIDGVNWFPAKGTRFNLTGYGISTNNYGEWVAVGYDTSSSDTILYSSE